MGINDMSLISGGLFDVNHDWKPPHNLHRIGRSVDIDRCATAGGSSILVNQALLDQIMAANGGRRIVEKSLEPPPCQGPISTPRMHYEF